MKKHLLLFFAFLCSMGVWAENLVVTYDFTAAANYPTGFPTSNSNTCTTETGYVFNGNTIYFKTANSGYLYQASVGSGASKVYSVFCGKNIKYNSTSANTIASTAYMKIPGKAGYKISKIVVTNASNAATSNINLAVCNDDYQMVIPEAIASSTSADMTFNINSTGTTLSENEAAYFCMAPTVASGKNLNVKKIVVTYTETALTTPYTVTFNAGTNGTCSTTSLTEASAGAGVTLPSCTPNANYGFVGWATTNDAASANAGKATETYYPTADVTLYAVYANLYTVTIETPTNGTLVVKNGETVVNNGDQVANGTTLNVTATPNRGYAFRNWQAVDATTHTYTTTFTYDVASDVTIKANFDELAKYTVTLADDNTELTPEYGGEAVVLPSRDAIGAYTFAGWSETNVAEETTTSPTIIEAGAYVAAANVTLYPVYTRSEAGGDTDVPVSIVIADNLPAGTASGDKVKSFTLDENVTATSTGGENNSSKIYGSPLSQWRFYRSDDGAMTVTTTAGTLKSVTVTYSVDKNGVMLHGTDEIASGTAVDNINAASITFTAGGGETGKTNGVIRITDIAVVYSVDGQTTYYWSAPIVAPTDVAVTVNSCGNASFSCDKALDFTDADVKAYMVTAETAENITLAEIKKVPANTGIFVLGEGGTYNIPVLEGDADDASANKLVATTGAKTVDGSENIWALSKNDGKLHPVNSGTIAAGKAYLVSEYLVAGGALQARGFIFAGTTTGINAVTNVATEGVAYNLAGQRVAANAKGIVIVNGKKFINK